MAILEEVPLKTCFIDEAGDLGIPPQPSDQPVLVIDGLFVDARSLANVTSEFLKLNFDFFPRLSYPPDNTGPHPSEINGSDLRNDATRGTARERKHAIGFVGHIFGQLRSNDVRMVAPVGSKYLVDHSIVHRSIPARYNASEAILATT